MHYYYSYQLDKDQSREIVDQDSFDSLDFQFVIDSILSDYLIDSRFANLLWNLADHQKISTEFFYLQQIDIIYESNFTLKKKKKKLYLFFLHRIILWLFYNNLNIHMIEWYN